MRHILSYSFYEQSTLSLARNLLGKQLVHESNEGHTIGRIVETEAYLGVMDQAAHSFNGRRTKRTEIMFGPPGVIYTYVMHTHCLFNIVTNKIDVPEAVLIRAIEPIEGESLMVKRRGPARRGVTLTNGPGKLTKAMGITLDDYGHYATESPTYIIDGPEPSNISIGKRVGIDNSGEARDYPYRFWITGNKYVSRSR
ncbi:DNA-3-methyladenine glycosylase [Alkalicoccobacillus plakortidis]|uniref:Putative 3-methyladenine DNA glycosylase n=1 Tax=Alkalicoccobacillus plakortidis TaxID=444060 RepID=A0ABT0XF56_9BACI|nr:DNA-3-methyladenine glycosylase [Alkalicoccobacillus plakortidis]MCM2674524.1 DNA-3-methyladenine glycosylase [Alkalicoccobacillus plakortidis]